MGSPNADEIRRIVEEEESLLARAKRAIAKEIARFHEQRHRASQNVALRRTLRDEAKESSEDDMPAILHELGVRHALDEMRGTLGPLPDRDSPYVAHLVLHENGRDRDYLLGHTSLIDAAENIRIVDWRVAPVAQIFYRYREGEEYEEEIAGRLAVGTVTLRRIVGIEGGQITQIVGENHVISQFGETEGRWNARTIDAMRAGGAGTAVRPGAIADSAPSASLVTALLDRTQFEAIAVPAEQPLLVFGTAGSGKTTVALHRLAKIAASDRQRFPINEMRVVVPETGLSRLCRRLLEPLGVRAAQVETVDEWATALARAVFQKKIKICFDPPALVTKLKRHPAFYEEICFQFARRSPKAATFSRLRKRLAIVLTDRPFLDRVVRRSGGEVPQTAMDETIRHTMFQIGDSVAKQLAGVTVPELKRTLDGRPIEEGTPEQLAGSVDIDDLAVLLSWHAETNPLRTKEIAHLVVDEAEDVSLFEFAVLGEGLGSKRSVTIAGDDAQTTADGFPGWEAVSRTMGIKRDSAQNRDGPRDLPVATCRLQTSYRCPRPIVEFANRVLGPLAPPEEPTAQRDGPPVEDYAFTGPVEGLLFVLQTLRDLVDREPRASIAVICSDETTRETAFRILAELPQARVVCDGEFSFTPGIDVTDVENTKGLEFDYVILPDVTAAAYPKTNEARRRLHVAATRASHQLWVISPGKPSPLLGEETVFTFSSEGALHADDSQSGRTRTR